MASVMVRFWCSPSVDELPRSPPITGSRPLGSGPGFHLQGKFQGHSAPQHCTAHRRPRHGDPILNHPDIPWRLAKMSQRLNNSIYTQHTHASSQSQFSIYLINTFHGNLRSLADRKLAGIWGRKLAVTPTTPDAFSSSYSHTDTTLLGLYIRTRTLLYGEPILLLMQHRNVASILRSSGCPTRSPVASAPRCRDCETSSWQL
jgi:hypothetical protein